MNNTNYLITIQCSGRKFESCGIHVIATCHVPHTPTHCASFGSSAQTCPRETWSVGSGWELWCEVDTLSCLSRTSGHSWTVFSVAGCIIPLRRPQPSGVWCCCGGVCLVYNSVWVSGWYQVASTWIPAEHCIVTGLSVSLIKKKSFNQSPFDVIADQCI